ncbi:uncharacterized protein STEHIDRAFT_123430 [Stereum hirsutum FP-91666 SS1]|uniref:uncharacterized protein n=1 Tax=Stereum hirsutum (strain FP-91666) TaxID=721885 RepID=UPI00044499D4|nr:uncharacterized protein STEHIDRAFT_123430 [Stereum hirsutum FP-91666 SS1]EIM83852.1 hypothetical protein STEHIDRAFT_123430 [Stereum hirsutum FP-91666 SS1]
MYARERLPRYRQGLADDCVQALSMDPLVGPGGKMTVGFKVYTCQMVPLIGRRLVNLPIECAPDAHA